MEVAGGAAQRGPVADDLEADSSVEPSTPGSSVHFDSTSSSGSRALTSYDSSSSISSPYYGGYDHSNHVVRVEYITDTDARRSLFALKLPGYLATTATIVLLALKTGPNAGAYFVLNRGWHIANAAIAAALLLILGSYYIGYVWRVIICIRSPKTWSPRRWRGAQMTSFRGAVMLVILALFLAVNAAVLARPSMWCSGITVTWIGCITWSLWNVLFALHTYYSACLVLIPSPDSSKRADMAVADLPLSHHWPLLLLMAAVQGVIICTLVNATSHDVIRISLLDPEPHACTWGAHLHCAPRAIVVVSSSLTVAGFAIYWVWSCYAIMRAWKQVHRRPYASYKITHGKIRLQIQYHIGFTIIIASSLLLWVAGTNACVNYALSWFGILPMTITMTGIVWLNLFLVKPRHPDAGPPKINELYQYFAWTESSKPSRLQRRNQELLDPEAHSEPMFCVETAIKLFYFSALIYDLTEADGHAFSTLPEPIRELLGEVEQAMSFYKLAQRRLFYDRTLETKILSAWSERTIVISIRGSQATANFIADAQVLQSTHPPLRKHLGHVPRVHTGFLRTYQAGGINELLLEHVQQLLDSAEDRGDVQILLTGHSLGGAVATLAAYDIVKKCGLRPDQVSCYTFGCPRVGNHAFARDYNETVPDTWSIINDQDVVTRGLKLYGLYKRAGHRVIINSAGDLIVRPSLFELTLMQLPFRASAAHHHTTSYQTALYSVLRSQMDKGKRHREGLAGVLELLKAAPIVHEALHQMAVKVGHSSLMDQLRSISMVSVNTANNSFRVSDVTSLQRGRGSKSLEEALAAVPVRTDAQGEEVFEPVYDEAEREADGMAASPTADAATPPDSVAVDMPAAEAPAAQRKPGSLWRRAAQHVQLSGGRRGVGGGRCDVAASFPADACKVRKCYIIPEDEGQLPQELTEDAAGPPCRQRSQWRCPLQAPVDELPENAQVHADGTIISIGSRPNMRACRCPKRRAAISGAA